MSAPPTSILVLGAGELGIEVIKSLSQHRQRGATRIAALLRPSTLSSTEPSKQAHVAQLRSWRVDLIAGDVENDTLAQLTEAFRAYHTVLSCTGMYAAAAVQVKLAQAAVAAGVARYFPWQYGIDYDAIGRASAQDLFDSQLDVRQLLRAQTATRWVIVSTGMFVSFLFEPAFGVVSADRAVVTAIGAWDNEITVTAPQDIGMLTAEIALACPEIEGVVYVAGDTVSMQRLADVVERVAARPVERVLKTVPQLKAELESDLADNMRKYRVVFAEGTGTAWSKVDSFNGVRGIPTQTVEEWAKAHLP